MKKNNSGKKTSIVLILLFSSLILTKSTMAQGIRLSTKYAVLLVSKEGYITSIKDRATNKEYTPAGLSSPLLALEKDKHPIYPSGAKWLKKENYLQLTYPNGSVATLKAESKGDYFRFELLALTPANGVDNVVWGPYKTKIKKYIGEIISVARDDDFAIGILGLDDNTTSGLPCDGDMSQSSYIIHTPDPVKYPLPANLKEGQRFRIGGDGNNDVAFYSHPEEYYRYMNGNGAQLDPAYGISIAMHARDRKKPATIFYPLFNDFPGN